MHRSFFVGSVLAFLLAVGLLSSADGNKSPTSSLNSRFGSRGFRLKREVCLGPCHQSQVKECEEECREEGFTDCVCDGRCCCV